MINSQPGRILIYQKDGTKELVEYLDYYKYRAVIADDNTILQKIKEHDYDLCLLDHCAWTEDSLSLLKAIRLADDKAPVIMVSENFDYASVIKAFDEGVDDYVIRPYNLEELIRRIKAVMRRCNARTRKTEGFYMIGKYLFDVKSCKLKQNTFEIKLIKREAKILALLCAYQNDVLPKNILLQEIWGESNYYNKRSLDLYICNLRKYLKDDPSIAIETKRGLGYSLTVSS